MSEHVREYRRQLHQIPELDRDLPETTAFVRGVLAEMPCTLSQPIPGSVCAFFDAGREETVAFRADMDALPVAELGDKPYGSRHPGKMHACGHDGHTAMVLELAHIVAQNLDKLPRNVLLIFQPAEETEGGAKDICATGLLEKYKVKRVFGCHLWPGKPLGTVWTRPGPLMAKNSEVDIVIHGRSVHITKSEQGVDALWIGVEMVRMVYEMVEKELPPEELRVLKFGHMVSGTVRNAISSRTEIHGSLRVFSMETFDFITSRVKAIARQLEVTCGCTIDIRFGEGYAPVINDPNLVQTVCAALGEEAPGLLERPDLTAEDFSFYQLHAPGMFCFLGIGDAPPLHAANFDFDEAALEAGVEFYQRLLFLP